MIYGPYPPVSQPTPEIPKPSGPKGVRLNMSDSLQKAVPMPAPHYSGQQPSSQFYTPWS
jgi:hypothetical protein